MSIPGTLIRKTLLAAALAAMILAAVPLNGAAALGAQEPPTPPAGGRQVSTDRLEQAWARQQHIYERLGKIFDNQDALVDKVQGLIDKAKANGKDVTAVQAALDAFSASIQDARPVYESAKGIIASHQGFDAAGKVTDTDKAMQTVHDMGDKLKEIRAALGGTGKALREAIRAFREANRPTPRPTSPS